MLRHLVRGVDDAESPAGLSRTDLPQQVLQIRWTPCRRGQDRHQPRHPEAIAVRVHGHLEAPSASLNLQQGWGAGPEQAVDVFEHLYVWYTR